MLDESGVSTIKPWVDGVAPSQCRAVVVLPARNEEDSLAAALDALAAQQDLHGDSLDRACFEILLLLNNCTDASAAVARAWQATHRDVALHVIECVLPTEEACVGTARRMLMDTACLRLSGQRACSGILSTDSDTTVAPDWIAHNLRALEAGADAVGGVIALKEGELERLPEGARLAYFQVRLYQRLPYELEDLLDPQAGDPWPRHLEHFGASLACTPAVYARVGGLPAVRHLEDMAFVDALYRADARLRHEPRVRVYTSSRFDGRATVGLSGQLRLWQHMYEAGEPHLVPNAALLEHRYRCLHTLRAVHRAGLAADLSRFTKPWQGRIHAALAEQLATGEFLGRIDCNAWIAETYKEAAQQAEITTVNHALKEEIRRERALRFRGAKPLTTAGVPADRAGNAPCDAP